MRSHWKKLTAVLVIASGVGAVVYAFLPQPVPVDVTEASRGGLRVTVNEDGKTRIKERYVVAAPLAGRLLRISLRAGDPVVAGETTIAAIAPNDPDLLDARARAEAEARVQTAIAAKERVLPALTQATAAYQLAESEFARISKLRAEGSASQSEFDSASYQQQNAAAGLRAAKFAIDVAEFEIQLARAALLHADPKSVGERDPNRFAIHSPITGRVLRVFQESATAITPGMRLVELGDPSQLELEIDVLSSDAVKISPGAKVLLEGWGGDELLNARVRVVEPAAFTKVSALGVEEQRVYIIADFTDPPEKWQRLGDAYRVDAKIVVWESADVLKVPVGALFRDPHGWAVFVVEQDRARLRSVQMGRSNGLEAEIQSGLTAGDRIVVHPGDRIHDGVAIRVRSSSDK
jgi:HlyD family secretion protein